jgi:putative membrane protein
MQLIRTLLLLLTTIILVAFVGINGVFPWKVVSINFWPQQDGTYVHLEWPVGLIVLASMVLGFLPMWLIHKGARWQLKRRIGFLENSVKSASQSVPVVAGNAASQLEGATTQDPLAPPQ